MLVLGGGVIGLACAYYLLKAGRSVTIIDQNTVGSGSSHGNCGTLTPSHATPLAQPGMVKQALRWMLTPDAPFRVAPRLDFELFEWMLQFARRCNWRDYHRIAHIKAPLLLRSRQLIGALIEQEKMNCEFAQSGTLYVHRDQKACDAAAGLPQVLADCGITMQPLDGVRCRALEPALNDSIVGGYFNPGDARLRPDLYVAELARIVRQLGAQIVEHAPIGNLRSDNGRVVAVDCNSAQYGPISFAPGYVVFALGAWSPQLARTLQMRIPIQPGKGYSITYTRPRCAPRIPLTLKERSICVTAWDSGYRLGSTMEFAGYDTSLNRARLDALKRGAGEYLIEPEGPQIVEEWYGWRPMTYDDLPILGRSHALQNLVFATGHGMLGVTLSAVTGELIAQLLSGTESAIEMNPFSPHRFKL